MGEGIRPTESLSSAFLRATEPSQNRVSELDSAALFKRLLDMLALLAQESKMSS